MFIRDPAQSGSGAVSEAILFQQAQAGCRDSLNGLMARHEGLVQAVVRGQVLGDLPFSDALQAGRIGLWRAIQGFDPTRGFAFSTYAWPAIQRRVWRAVTAGSSAAESSANHSRHDPPAEIRESLLPSPPPDPELIWETAQVHEALHDLIQRLSPRLRYVIVARYGLNGHRSFFYRQIGAALGVCGERARQLHIEALVWLRHPAHSYALRSLLGRHDRADYEKADGLAQRWLRQRGGRYDL